MTAEQKQTATVQFAEEMGWSEYRFETENTYPCFIVSSYGDCVVCRDKLIPPTPWNPFTSLADAIELAEKLGIEFAYRIDKVGGVDITHKTKTKRYFIAWSDRGYKRPDLRTAICEASLEYLTREGRDAN